MKTGDPSYVLRIDKKTGKTLARRERPTKAQMESPDTRGIVASRCPQSGQLRIQPDHCIAHGEERHCLCVLPGQAVRRSQARGQRKGDVSESARLWTYDRGPDVPTPASDGRHIYIANDRGILFCVDARTGKEVWGGQRIASAVYSSSPTLADGKVYITNEEGATTVIEAEPRFKVLAENRLDEYTLSSPAVSEGQIFIRTEKALYCIGKRTKR